jgi:hypothetical protein
MQSSGEWPAATRIDTRRLILEPLQVAHADEMVFVLGDEALYEYTGGAPPALEELRVRYARQVSGPSPDRTRGWLNWIVREGGHGVDHRGQRAWPHRNLHGLDGETRWTRRRP